MDIARILYAMFYFRCVVEGVVATAKTVEMTVFDRNPTLNGFICPGKDAMFSKDIASFSRCMYECISNEYCMTIFHESSNGRCIGCSEIYTGPSSLFLQQGNVALQRRRQVFADCGSGWSRFQNSCYRLTTGSGSFYDGINECEADGGKAVYIETSEENDFVKDLAKTDQVNHFWYLGLTDVLESRVWRYYATNVTAVFQDFFYSEPNDNIMLNNEECTALSSLDNYQWIDHYCYLNIPTICERGL